MLGTKAFGEDLLKNIYRLIHQNHQIDDLILINVNDDELLVIFELWFQDTQYGKNVWLIDSKTSLIYSKQLFSLNEIDKLLKEISIASILNYRNIAHSRIMNEFLIHYNQVLKTNWKQNTGVVDLFIKKLNYISSNGILSCDIIDCLKEVGRSRNFPNILLRTESGSKFLDLISPRVYKSLLKFISRPSEKLYILDQFYAALGEIIPHKGTRGLFFLDLTKNAEYPEEFQRVWLFMNTKSWNMKGFSKIDHSSVQRAIINLFFEKTSSVELAKISVNLSYGKSTKYWKLSVDDLVKLFSKDIELLNTGRGPQRYVLRQEFTIDKIKSIMSAMFWKCGELNPGFFNTSSSGSKSYTALINYMKGNSTQTLLELDNFIQNHKFIITFTDKNRALSFLLPKLSKLRDSGDAIQLYNEWIIKGEVGSAESINGFILSTDEAMEFRRLEFTSIDNFMSENNDKGITALVEALFENEEFIKMFNDKTGKDLGKLKCINTGQRRKTSVAASVAYPDITATTDDQRHLYMQIKNLGKTLGTEKKTRVLIDQLKSLYGFSDEYKNITIHIIHATEIERTLDPKLHKSLINCAKEKDAGIINIGVWTMNDRFPGVAKLGEIISSLKNVREATPLVDDKITLAVETLSQVGKISSEADVNHVKGILEQLSCYTYDDYMLTIEILELYGLKFIC